MLRAHSVEQVRAALDRAPVDGLDHVDRDQPPAAVDLARLEAGPLGGAALVHGGHAHAVEAVARRPGIVEQAHAEPRPRLVAVLDQLGHDLLDHVDGHGEADAGVGPRGADDGRVDPDQPPADGQEKPEESKPGFFARALEQWKNAAKPSTEAVSSSETTTPKSPPRSRLKSRPKSPLKSPPRTHS